MSSARRTIAPVVLLLALIGLWELYVDLHGVDMSSPQLHAARATCETVSGFTGPGAARAGDRSRSRGGGGSR